MIILMYKDSFVLLQNQLQVIFVMIKKAYLISFFWLLILVFCFPVLIAPQNRPSGPLFPRPEILLAEYYGNI